MTTANMTELSSADMDAVLSIDNLMDELDEIVAAEAETETHDAAPAEEEIVAAVGEVEIEEARAEAYADQEGSSESEDPATPGEEVKEKAKRMKTAGMKPSDVIRAKIGEKVYETLLFSSNEALMSDAEVREVVDARLEAIDKLPKKIGEKAVNLIQHVVSGVTLSCYTVRALEVLKAKGTITMKDVYDDYRTRPYSEGTSSAQSSQMAQLLPFFEIAYRDGKTFTKNEDSTFLMILSS